MMRLKKLAALLISSALFMTQSSGVFAKEIVPVSPYSGEFEAVDQIADYITELYIDDTVEKNEIIRMGISGLLEENPDTLVPLLKEMFSSLDEYSEFFTAEEYRDYINSVNQAFYGIGVIIQKNGDYVEIIEFSEPNSKAEKSGFKAGDKIYAVEGQECKGKSLNDVRNLIVGELGTTVNVTVLRGDELIDLVATRVEVRQSTVTGGTFEGNIGYMNISTFGDTTYEEFKLLLEDFRIKGVEKIILDLRNNGGGRVDTAVAIAKLIVPKGKIVEVKYRDEQYDTIHRSTLAEKEFDFITLVNENTASSAEILASALQDSGASKLIGTRTFGKAVIQTVFPLTNGMKFKLTIGEYKTRNGREINGVGLEPDSYIQNITEKIDATEYTVFDFRTRMSMGDMSSQVIAAKERLSLLGYFDGKIDDTLYTEDLKNSVEAFQRDNALCDNGVLDIATQVKMQDLFEKLETVVDLQLHTAYEAFGGDPEALYTE